MLKSWGLIGGIVAAMAAGVYVLWGPISDKKKMRKGIPISIIVLVDQSESIALGTICTRVDKL